MDIGLHLLFGSLIQKACRGKVWLFALPAFLSHAYIDYFTHLIEPASINWFGLRTGIEINRSLISWAGFEGVFTAANIGFIALIVISIVLWFIFLRRYWLGVVFAWVLWDGLWIVQQLGYWLGFSPPPLHDSMLYFLTRPPWVYGMHTLLLIWILLILHERFPALMPLPEPLNHAAHSLKAGTLYHYRRTLHYLRRKLAPLTARS